MIYRCPYCKSEIEICPHCGKELKGEFLLYPSIEEFLIKRKGCKPDLVNYRVRVSSYVGETEIDVVGSTDVIKISRRKEEISSVHFYFVEVKGKDGDPWDLISQLSKDKYILKGGKIGTSDTCVQGNVHFYGAIHEDLKEKFRGVAEALSEMGFGTLLIHDDGKVEELIEAKPEIWDVKSYSNVALPSRYRYHNKT